MLTKIKRKSKKFNLDILKKKETKNVSGNIFDRWLVPHKIGLDLSSGFREI